MRTTKILITCLIVTTLYLSKPAFVVAHPLPPITHWFTTELTENRLHLHKALYFHPKISHHFIDRIDTNNNKEFDTTEVEEWKSATLAKLNVWFLNEKISPNKIDLIIPEYYEFIKEEKPLELYLYYDIKFDCSQNPKIEIEDRTKHITDAMQNAFISHEYYKFENKDNDCTTISYPHIPDYSSNNVIGVSKSSYNNHMSNFLSIVNPTEMLKLMNTDTSITILLLIALILGSIHALTPGHGKTLIAAYLVGQHGTIKHALSLALITTLTHTSTIFILGLLSLTATSFFAPEAIVPKIELISATAIVLFGIYLFNQRIKEYRHAKSHNFDAHDHHHHDHSYDHTHHEHDHGHLHSFEELKTTKITFKSLLALGISGGINPCPEALAIMLVAISLNQILFGLSLITVFSIGLAGTLVSLGIIAIKSKSFLKKSKKFDQVSHLLPLISSVVILLLGSALLLSSVMR